MKKFLVVLLCSVALLGFSFVGTRAGDAKKFQYKRVAFPQPDLVSGGGADRYNAKIEETLNAAGSDGWELVTFSTEGGDTYIYFKR